MTTARTEPMYFVPEDTLYVLPYGSAQAEPDAAAVVATLHPWRDADEVIGEDGLGVIPPDAEAIDPWDVWEYPGGGVSLDDVEEPPGTPADEV